MLYLFHLYLCGPASQPGEEECFLKKRYARWAPGYINIKMIHMIREPRYVTHLNKLLKYSGNRRILTMHIFLRDAMGPDKRGEPTHISLEHALMNRELQVITRQNYWVLVIITNNSANWCWISVNVVCIELLLLLQYRRFLKSLAGSQMVTSTVWNTTIWDSTVWGLIVGVHYLVIFVWFVVVLSHGAYLLTCHYYYLDVTFPD